MKELVSQLCATALVGSFLLAVSCLQAADVKSYQVTGPVLEITPAKIVVQKGDDKWEIARTAQSKVPADLKVGDKVTIYYTMTANEVEIEGGKKK
jgi:LysM repeat protein